MPPQTHNSIIEQQCDGEGDYGKVTGRRGRSRRKMVSSE